MKALCPLLLACFALSFQAMAESDTAQARNDGAPRFSAEPALIPVLDFQRHMEMSEFIIPDAALPDTPAGPPFQHPAPRLLPDNMSLMERGLWGEHGFLRWIGIAGELTPESRKSELTARRTMLTMHQIGGFVTLGLMGVTLYYGQQALNHSNDPALDRSYQNKHNQFVTYTIISYGLTGLLAVLSPPPLIRRGETSTTTIHKTLAWVHVAGMILTPIVGSMVRKRSGHFSYIDLPTAHFHQAAAYVTAGVFAASLIVITF
jgi:hypothetical protein